MTQPFARVLLDSVSPAGSRVTTMEVVIHRFVLAEFNTHRVFSRNSASSRAIPFHKMLDRVLNDPAMPMSWPSEQRGMQGGCELSGIDILNAKTAWLTARNNAVESAHMLHDIGAHKSVVNRLLEPFLWHTVIVTGTTDGYENFFKQRCSQLAQPELRMAADLMRAAWLGSTPEPLDYYEWHTPLIQPEDDELIHTEGACRAYNWDYDQIEAAAAEVRRRVSTARCARVSYLTHDGRRDISKDLELYDRLVLAKPPHWSPLEHVCRPQADAGHPHPDAKLGANLSGWIQMRHIVETEKG